MEASFSLIAMMALSESSCSRVAEVRAGAPQRNVFWLLGQLQEEGVGKLGVQVRVQESSLLGEP